MNGSLKECVLKFEVLRDVRNADDHEHIVGTTIENDQEQFVSVPQMLVRLRVEETEEIKQKYIYEIISHVDQMNVVFKPSLRSSFN